MKQTRTSPFRFARAAMPAFVMTAFVLFTLVGQGHATPGHGPEDHAKHFARVAAALGLTEQQKAAVKKIHEEAAAKAAPLREQARLQHEEIHAMLESGSADPAELGHRMISLHATHKQVVAVHEQAAARVKAHLNAEQRAKFDKLHDEHAGFPGHGHSMGPFGNH